ncbi:hypothetical protein ACQKKX_04410 [Neorhizobium sp. NPDC001467]|uniref:hypothetical protein n=1 Tax=Neorhizobium sp. NPDC001467 TaxID=3390595 RepID=UPI003CFC0E93
MSEIVVLCECCGRPGGLIGAGDDVRAKCVLHADVIDAEDWRAKRESMSVMFENEQEAIAHFLQDYGAGLDLMKELMSDGERDPEDPDEIKH